MAKPLFTSKTSFHIPPAWRPEIEALAEKRQVRVAELLRRMVREYLDKHGSGAADQGGQS